MDHVSFFSLGILSNLDGNLRLANSLFAYPIVTPHIRILFLQKKMENSLETTTAKAVAGRFRNNMVGQPRMYIDILMITRRFTRGPGPADRRYSGAGHPQAPDEGGEVGAGASASPASRFRLPGELSPALVEPSESFHQAG